MRTTVRRLTPAGAGGVAVLEVCGPEALAAVARLAARPPRVGRLALVVLEEAGELFDEALVWAESAQRCEVHLHGSPPLVEVVQRALGGATEPPQAASLEDEAWEALADAPGEAAARMLLDQAEGALRGALQELLRAPDPGPGARELLARARGGLRLVEPPRVVLRGPVNAGKSTLFNALVGHERALVHGEEGTTRDAVRGRAALGDWVFELVDTAGERALAGADPGSAVERAGQGLAHALARAAHLVLAVSPAALLEADTPPRPGEVRVASRADEGLAGRSLPPDVCLVSALCDPRDARLRVGQALRDALGLHTPAWSAGQAVPFTAEQVERLSELAAGAVGARQRLAELLARGAADSSHPPL